MNARIARRKRTKPAAEPLDAAAAEAMERFARVMAHCGFAPKTLARAFERAIAATHVKIDPKQRQVLRELPEAAHLVTLWCSSPDYVDERGAPRPLPARGSERSIEVLARSVDPSLDLGELLRYLLRTQTLRKVGNTYALNRRWVYLRGVPGYAHGRSIRGLNGMLRTLDHNLSAETGGSGWFEFTAGNQHFPVSQLTAFERWIRREGLAWLRKLDLFMQRCAAECDPAEPTVWLGVGMHRYQHDRPGTASPTHRSTSPPGKPPVKRRKRRRS
jgi:hypothetical protein